MMVHLTTLTLVVFSIVVVICTIVVHDVDNGAGWEKGAQNFPVHSLQPPVNL